MPASRRRPFAASPAEALPGADGRKVAGLVRTSVRSGRRLFADICRRAVERSFAAGLRGVGPVGFTDADTAALAEAFAKVVATGELLGRSRAVLMAARAGDLNFAARVEPTVFAAFPDQLEDVLPADAIEYFRRLVPKLGVDPERYLPDLRRRAFTVARITEATMLTRVRDALARAIAEPSEAAPDRQGEVRRILEAAGVDDRDGSYSEMVFRTNVLDAYHAGLDDQLADPEVGRHFPAWQYLGVEDGRQGADHQPKFGKFYPGSATFAAVRGERVFNCRCSKRPLTAGQWAALQKRGARLEESW